MSLVAEDDKYTSTGKTFPGKTVNAMFRPTHGVRGHGRFTTKDRDVAKNLYLSDSFRKGTCWDLQEREAEIYEDKYQRFLTEVNADPERLARLRRDMIEEPAPVEMTESVGA